jgi:hypothetical protein
LSANLGPKSRHFEGAAGSGKGWWLAVGIYGLCRVFGLVFRTSLTPEKAVRIIDHVG